MEEEILKCHICDILMDEYSDEYFMCKVCSELTCEEHLGTWCTNCCDLDENGEVGYEGYVEMCSICTTCYGEE